MWDTVLNLINFNHMKKTLFIFCILLMVYPLFSQNLSEACSQDYDNGYNEGYAEGYAAGYKAAYKAFKEKNQVTVKKHTQRSKVMLPDNPDKSYMFNLLNGKVLDKDDNVPEPEKIDKEYYIIFYGGYWCPYCKKEAPLIKEWYNEQKSKNDNFEVILAGTNRDKSSDDLLKYMQNEQFPFLYVDYDYLEDCKFFSMEAYTKAEKFYVPAYILMDKNGKVLSRTNVEKKDDYDLHRPLEEYLKIIKKK